jgi:polysaccharide pyruvyl transferase WcaK-like protein
MKLMKHTDRAVTVNASIFSPMEYQSIIAQTKLFIGVRLHSTILATCSLVPSMTLFYVDKGREYFRQIGFPECAFPIETMLDSAKLPRLQQAITRLHTDRKAVQSRLAERVGAMRQRLYADFEQIRDQVSR